MRLRSTQRATKPGKNPSAIGRKSPNGRGIQNVTQVYFFGHFVAISLAGTYIALGITPVATPSAYDRKPAQVAKASPVTHSPVTSCTLSQAMPLSILVFAKCSSALCACPLSKLLQIDKTHGWGACLQPISAMGYCAKDNSKG